VLSQLFRTVKWKRRPAGIEINQLVTNNGPAGWGQGQIRRHGRFLVGSWFTQLFRRDPEPVGKP